MNDIKITEAERQLIVALRGDASVQVYFHTREDKSKKEAVNKIKPFSTKWSEHSTKDKDIKWLETKVEGIQVTAFYEED